MTIIYLNAVEFKLYKATPQFDANVRDYMSKIFPGYGLNEKVPTTDWLVRKPDYRSLIFCGDISSIK